MTGTRTKTSTRRHWHRPELQLPRLIEVEQAQELPPRVTLEVGDLVRIGATGGWVEDGVSLKYLGAFRTGYMRQVGRVIAHSGPPNATLFHAIEPGRARISLFTGDPYHHPGKITVEVDVQPAGTGD
jgi:hypothetical protein